MKEAQHVDRECIKDPTLARRRDMNCERCGHYESVTFTQPTKDRMNLIFVCTRCTHYWKKEPTLEELNAKDSDDEDK